MAMKSWSMMSMEDKDVLKNISIVSAILNVMEIKDSL